MENYNQIDIALDPFPCNGITTSYEALWMSVPVVTLVGKTHVSRGLLSNLGLQELIADSPDEYMQIVIQLAKNKNKLRELRSQIRSRVLQSPLTDAEKFTRNLEKEFRQVWKVCCEEAKINVL